MVFAVIALLLTGGVAAIPAITKDRTCHNMFRDGRRTGVTPQARIGLEIDVEGWPKLIQTLQQFAAAHSLSFRNASKSHPEVVQALYLSLCNERGVNITVNDQRWASRSYNPFGGGGVPIGVYELQAGSGWEPLTRSLIGVLESSWPGSVRYRDGNGRVVPIPDHLR